MSEATGRSTRTCPEDRIGEKEYLHPRVGSRVWHPGLCRGSTQAWR